MAASALKGVSTLLDHLDSYQSRPISNIDQSEPELRNSDSLLCDCPGGRYILYVRWALHDLAETSHAARGAY